MMVHRTEGERTVSATSQNCRKVTSRRTATRRRTRPSPPTPLKITVPFAIPPNVRVKFSRDWIVKVSVRALVHHLLYGRGVVPAQSFELLQRHRDSISSPDKRLSAVERKFVRCGSSLEQLLREWDLLCSPELSLLQFSQVLISLGPSSSRPREQYVLDLTNLGEDDGSGSCTDPPVPSQEHAFSRRLVCSLLKALNPTDDDDVLSDMNQQFLVQPSPANASCKLFVSVRLRSDVLKQMLGRLGTGNETRAPKDSYYSLLQRVIVRHDFSTAASQKMQKSHVVQIQVKSETNRDWPSFDDDAETAMWITLPTSVKGFRM